MRALAVISAALTLGVTTHAWSQHRAPPARDRPVPVAVLVNIGQCNGVLRNYEKRQECRACVSRGGRFHTQGRGPGRCELPPPPPPPPPRPAFAVNAGECHSFAGHRGKVERCLGCVGRGGRFHLPGPGRCDMPPPPPPPPAPPVLVSVGECNAHVVRPPKRARCVHCVTHGGRFHRQGGGPGRCEMPPPPPPPPRPAVAVNAGECHAFGRRTGKTERCLGCVGRGGRFHLHGPGRCEMPPPPPPPARPDVAVNGGECRTFAGHRGKVERCLGCVGRGGRFFLGGPGRCDMPPPPPPPADVITSVPECNHRLPQKHVRKECKHCVKKGGRFHVMDRTCRF